MQASATGIALTAVADGLPGFGWCKRNDVVYTDLPEKTSLIIALITRLIWGEKKIDNNSKQRATAYLHRFRLNQLHNISQISNKSY